MTGTVRGVVVQNLAAINQVSGHKGLGSARGKPDVPTEGVVFGAQGWVGGAWPGVTGTAEFSVSGTEDVATLRIARAQAVMEALRENAPEARALRQLASDVRSLQDKIDEIFAEVRARPIVKQTTIVDLDDEEYHLRLPISIVLEEYSNEITASWPEIEAFGSGDSPTEAILSLKRDIVSLYDDLRTTPNDELGVLPQSWKRALESVVVRNGEASFQSP